MNALPYIITANSVTVLANGKSYSFAKGDESFDAICDSIRSYDWETVEMLIDKSESIRSYSNGAVEVTDGVVYFCGKPVHNVVTDRILNFMNNGLPFQPLVNFLTNLMENPSRRAVNELYTFLENKSLPITPDGTFLAYKAIQHDWMSKTSGKNGKIDNHIGSSPRVDRNEVCDDADIGCSYGLHAGSLEYVKGFATGDDRIVIVEINPVDVISIPKDNACQKLRACSYNVIGEYQGELNESPAYEITGTSVKPMRRDSKGRFVKKQARDSLGRFV